MFTNKVGETSATDEGVRYHIKTKITRLSYKQNPLY